MRAHIPDLVKLRKICNNFSDLVDNVQGRYTFIPTEIEGIQYTALQVDDLMMTLAAIVYVDGDVER